MYTLIKDALEDWSLTTDSRRKLQHAYLLVAVSLLFVAGITGLINYELGQKILFIAILAGAMFVINAVTWALLQSFVLLKISAGDIGTKTIETAKSQTTKRPSQKK